MEDQEGKWCLGGGGLGARQSPCTVPPPGSDHTKVKVVQSHRVRCLGTLQTSHALVRKLATVWHLVWLPSKDKEGKGESLGVVFQAGLEPWACPGCHIKECGHSASEQFPLVTPGQRWPGAWRRNLVTDQPEVFLSISSLCYSFPGYLAPKGAGRLELGCQVTGSSQAALGHCGDLDRCCS